MCDHSIGGHCCHSHKADNSPSFSLYWFIDTNNVECLNESVSGSGKLDRKDSTVYVESDVDQELLFNIPFTGNIKLMSIIISGADTEQHPSQVSLYKNKPFMTFEDLSAECEQSLELTVDPNGEVIYPLKISRFSNVQTLSLHFSANYGGDTTRIHYIGLRGDYTPAPRREAVITNYEVTPNVSDLKDNILQTQKDEVLRLYHRQEYFRKAYNNTLKRMDTLANSLPSYALDYITTSGYHKDALNKEDEEEEDIPLDPDYINFMMKTIQHRQNRDNIESNVYDIQSMLKAPPRKLNQSTDIQTIDSQIEMLEASLLHYYEFVSPCRDSPVWPVLPLKRSFIIIIMGVRGLTTYLQSDPRNFTEYQLHNTTVIIDGLNFLNFLYFDSGLYTQFNGEYLAFSGVIHRFINTLKRCNINPIFVLDGCHDHFKLNTQMKRNYQRMQTCRQLLNSIKHNQLSSTHSLYNVQLLPPLTIITFIQILNQLNIHYITCDSEADQNVMNLGIYFKCPIISNDSDFYITIPNHNHNDNPMNNDDDGVSFLPLSLISFKPIINIIPCYSCQKHNQLCMYIKCQKFLINGPGLKNLSINQRSLLACLLGNDYISSNQFIHKLPISFNDKTILFHHHNTMTKQIKLKRRKLIILQLINWLLQFNDNHNDTNLDKPIQCLLNKYPKLQRNQLYHQLMYSIHTYHIHSNLFYLHFNNDLKLFKRIPTFVNKNNIKSDIGCTIGNSSSSSSSSRCSRNTMMKSVTIQQQLSSLNSSYSSEYDKEIDENQILTIKEEDDDVDAEDDSRDTMMKSVTIQQQLSPLNSSYSSEYDKEIDENQIITIEEQEKGGERGEEEENDNDSEDDSRNTMIKSVTIQQQLSSLNSSYSSEYDS
ncbi:unnamed protein product, partial [Schistosoma mattheei]